MNSTSIFYPFPFPFPFPCSYSYSCCFRCFHCCCCFRYCCYCYCFGNVSSWSPACVPRWWTEHPCERRRRDVWGWFSPYLTYHFFVDDKRPQYTHREGGLACDWDGRGGCLCCCCGYDGYLCCCCGYDGYLCCSRSLSRSLCASSCDRNCLSTSLSICVATRPSVPFCRSSSFRSFCLCCSIAACIRFSTASSMSCCMSSIGCICCCICCCMTTAISR